MMQEAFSSSQVNEDDGSFQIDDEESSPITNNTTTSNNNTEVFSSSQVTHQEDHQPPLPHNNDIDEEEEEREEEKPSSPSPPSSPPQQQHTQSSSSSSSFSSPLSDPEPTQQQAQQEQVKPSEPASHASPVSPAPLVQQQQAQQEQSKPEPKPTQQQAQQAQQAQPASQPASQPAPPSQQASQQPQQPAQQAPPAQQVQSKPAEQSAQQKGKGAASKPAGKEEKPATWVPDESSTTCTTCKTPFTFLNRRHHCRRCGGLFCNDCCGLNTSLPERYGQKKRSRVCNKCFKLTIKERLTQPDFTTIADGGPSTETKVVSSMLKVLYWKMGAHEGGLFDRTTIDVGETSAGAISVQQVQDLMTDTEVNPVRIRVYTPTHKWKGSDKRAILVWFHTGNFCTRSIESPSVDGLARLLANQVPVTIVSVDYRLAPDHAFPAAVEDGYEAVSWAVNNAVSMESHPSLISVGGDGAGGNIAAAVALMARDKGLPGGARLLSQLLVTPPLNLSDNPTGPEYASREANKNAYMLPLSQFTWFVQQYAKTENKTSPYLSPILATDLSNLPPTLVIGAGHDLFHSEDKAYASKMRAAGVRVIHTLYSNSANGFFGSGLDESDEAVMELVLFLSNEIIAQIKKL